MLLGGGRVASTLKKYATNPNSDSSSRPLVKNTYQLRVDFYVINHKIYFGELTFFHDSGCCKFNPPEWDEHFGDMLKLPIDEEG